MIQHEMFSFQICPYQLGHHTCASWQCMCLLTIHVPFFVTMHASRTFERWSECYWCITATYGLHISCRSCTLHTFPARHRRLLFCCDFSLGLKYQPSSYTWQKSMANLGYDAVNRALAAHFGLAGWFSSVVNALDTSRRPKLEVS